MTKPENRNHHAAVRAETAALTPYLKIIEARAKRSVGGDPRTAAVIEKQLGEVIAALELGFGTPLARVRAISRKLELEAALATRTAEPADTSEAEAAFVANVVAVSRRNKISRAAWRKFGVPASVLDEAGLL